jgi:chemotaxis protein histidine kinase CheA
MAQLTDKQKAAAILGDVEPEKAAETTTEETTDLEPEEQQLSNEIEQPEGTEEEPAEEEKPAEAEPEPESKVSFTKAFPNLKGETAEEYLPELEKAYDNSFKEALRLKKENDDLKARLTQPAPATPAEPTTPVAPTQLQEVVRSLPEFQRVQANDTANMITAFDDFKKVYPQATDQEEFDKFQKVSNGVNQSLFELLGRRPTWEELYEGIAGTLHWEPTAPTPAKDAAIKAAGSSTHTNSTTVPTAKRPRVSDDQVNAYLKMFTSKTREEAIKELSEVI